MTDILIIIGLVALIIAIFLIRAKREYEPRASEPKRVIPVKTPPEHDIVMQLNKVLEEVEESREQILHAVLSEQNGDLTIRDYASIQLIAEELVDVQVACETALNMLGLNQEQRDQVRQRVNQKNYLRGYHGN